MNFRALKATFAVCAFAAALTGCGGGGTPPAPTLDLSGTAAVGPALAGATVQVKCASGTGTATTTNTGTYDVVIDDGALPCALQVTGSGAASSIVLRSTVDVGSTDAVTAVTSAQANVTPLTELVVAQLAAALPAEFFSNFDGASAGLITPDKLNAASATVTAALKNAGIDFGSVDPFKSKLVAASGGTAGNSYDQSLDRLGAKVPVDALPLLVTQLAAAAASGSTSELSGAMTAVSGGGLPGCPYVLSGNFRAIDYFGRMTLRPIDFSAGTFGAGDGVNQMSLVQDGTNPCSFTATLELNGQVGEWQVAFGPGGVGVYRARNTAPIVTAGMTGLIFPVQSHSYQEVAGRWTFLQSGLYPEGVQNYRGQIALADDRTASTCDYTAASGWACNAESSGLTVAERSDGGFDLADAGTVAVNLYAYRAPSGALNVFGTTNASGSDSAAEQTNLVGVKIEPYTLPEVGSTTRYSETLVLFDWLGTRSTTGVTASEVTITSVDAAANTMTRSRLSDGRIDTWHLNAPIAGLNTRDAGTVNGTRFSAAYQMKLPGLGITLVTNAEGAPGRFYGYSALRP